jgi:DNA-directed RNA polymerase specialized sigma subunit
MDPAPTEPRLTRDQQALVERAAHRVPQIARQVRHLLGGISFEECESAGYEALVRSALRYDPSLGVPFTGYAYPRVRGAMLDAARRASPDRRRLDAGDQAAWRRSRRRGKTTRRRRWPAIRGRCKSGSRRRRR